MLNKKKILIVDDSETALMLATMVLKKFHLEIVTAKDGEEGIEKAKTDKPDLILLDLVMPKKNGMETLKEIRNMEGIKAIPIIMVTTHGEAEKVEKSYTYGCNDYIIKPFKSGELISKIESLVEIE